MTYNSECKQHRPPFPNNISLSLPGKGKTIDANQEMIALGLCNIFGSFVSSMPTTGSFTRTAVNNTSGVRTTLGGIVTGSLVLLSLGLLTQTFFYIPKAVLAAVIISAMIFMVDVEMAVTLWRTKSEYTNPTLVNRIDSPLILQDWTQSRSQSRSWRAFYWAWSTAL